MIDAPLLIRNYLTSKAALTARVGPRIYAERDVPPPAYKPGDGDAIAFKIRGGRADYEDALLNPSVQFKVYSTSEASAWVTYRALHDALHNGYSATVLHAEEEGVGQCLEEPDTDWVFVLSFFTIMLRQS